MKKLQPYICERRQVGKNLRDRDDTSIKVGIIESALIKCGLAKNALCEFSAYKFTILEFGVKKISSFNYRCRKIAILVENIFSINVAQATIREIATLNFFGFSCTEILPNYLLGLHTMRLLIGAIGLSNL